MTLHDSVQMTCTADSNAPEALARVAEAAGSANLVLIEEKARKIVPGDDPRALEAAKQLISMDDDSLIETAGAIKAQIAREEAAFAEEIAQDRLLVRIAETVMKDRIIERKARMLPSDTYRCEVETTRKPDPRIDVLRALQGKVPADRLKDAFWPVVTVDVNKIDPAFLAQIMALEAQGVTVSFAWNVTKLKILAKDYGGEVAEIVERGVPYVESAPKFIFEPKEQAAKNVSQIKAAF